MEFSQHLREEPEGSQPYTCAKGHRSSLSLSLSTPSDGRICLVCLTTLLSDPHSLSHHLSFALSNLSLALRLPCDRIPSAQTTSFIASLRTSHPHLLVAPLVRALSSACDRADDALARQVAEVVIQLAAALDSDTSVVGDFLTRISQMLCLSGSLMRQLHTLHCFGLLLASHHHCISATSIRDKYALFSKLLDGLQLPSEEVRGEILFILFKLSQLQASPWDDDDDYNIYSDDSCGNYMADLLTVGALLLRHSLNVLLKTQSDDVRLNCIALLLVLAKRGVFDNLLVKDRNCIGARDEHDCTDMSNETVACTPLVSLFADAVKGSLLSSNTEVQAGALDLIAHFLSWGLGCVDQIQAFIEENIADYIFEVLRLSGKNDVLVISCIKVLSLLSTAEDFKQKLAIGFQTVLSVLHYVAEIPYHPVQPDVLKLVLSCVTYCTGIMSPHQMKEIAVTLTQIFKSHNSGNLGLHLETFVLASLIYVEILKSQSACDVKELPSLIKEASNHAISSILSNYEASDSTLLLHSLYLLKEALVYSHEGDTEIDKNNEKISLETGIVETCEAFLLPWIQSDIQDEDALLGVLELFHTILLNGSPKSASLFASLLVSSSWFILSFGFLGVFPGESLKSMVYMIHGLVVDRVLGDEFGDKIRDVYLHLPSDPLDLLYLLGQKCLLDFNLASCQHAVLVLLYASSLYGERIADETQTLASLEQYILINSSNFTHGRTDCMILTQLILLYSGIRGTLSMCQAPYSPEAEKTVFNLITYKEWDLLSMRVDPVALKWLFQQNEIISPLSNQILNFCQSNSSNSTGLQLDTVHSVLDLQTIAKLAVTGDNHLISVLVLILGQVVETGQEVDALYVLNVINEIIRVFPESSNQFCLCGIANALNSLCGALNSSAILEASSVIIFNILYSASYKELSDEEGWLALTLKLLEKLENSQDSQLIVEQENILLGIFCLILHYSTRQVLKVAAKAVIFSRSLVSLMDRVVQEACAKGPALSEHGEDTPLGELLIFVLLLSFFSLRSLRAILEAEVDWQDFFQSGTDSHSTLVLGIPCHDLCKILSTGSSLIKLVSSQCLAELFDRISEQKMRSNEELKCSPRYLQSIISVAEGFVFHENGIVSRNCGSILATILGWENRVLRDCSNKWCKLIVEELVVGLGTASGLSSKGFAYRQEGLVGVVVSLLRWEPVPIWIGKLFRETVVSGIVNQLTARNVTGEIVKLFRELMKRNYLTQEHVSILHHLFQICRRQLYGETEANQLDLEESEKFAMGHDDSGELWIQLIHLMRNQSKDYEVSRVKNKKLLDEIDLFFQESGKQN